MEGFGMKTMKRMLLALLLALGPACAQAASILWVSVDPDARVLGPDGVLLQDPLQQFKVDGNAANAAKVSVADAGGTTTYLLFAYEVGEPPSQQMVTDDSSSDTFQFSFPGSGDPGTGGSGTGSSGDTQSAGQWIPVCLADFSDSSLTIKLELGYVDWGAYDAYVEQNPGGSLAIDDRFFQGLATATAPLGDLQAHVTEQSDLNTPSSTPWKPDTFTAVPEPSVCLTALLGALLLAKRRRGGARGRSPAGS